MIDVKTLALYLGSEVRCKEANGIDMILTVDLEFLSDFENQCYNEVKLLLRPPLSMTEAEYIEMAVDNADAYRMFLYELVESNVFYKPQEFQYLISKGFDMFGLIENGDAIDSMID